MVMKKYFPDTFRRLLRRLALFCLAGFASGAWAETGVATLSVGLAEGQHFKIRGATTCQLRYEGEGSVLAKGRDIVLTLPPFFKFVTTPVNGEGYTVEYRPVKRGVSYQNMAYVNGGVPLPAKYYTADYGTVEANAAELLAFAPSNRCEQLTLHLDNVAASRQFNLSFAIQVDPSWSSWNPTDPKTGQVFSMSGITAYRHLGELMVLAGAHCDAIPLNICAWVVNAGEDEAVCEAVFHGTSRITNEDGTEPFESELSLPSKGPPNVKSFIQHGYNLYNVRPRFDSAYMDLVDFEPWYYPYSDIQIFFPVPSDASMSMRYFGDGSRNTYNGSWGEKIGISLAEVEAVCANYPVVEHDGKKYWLVYDLNQDAGYPRGQTQIDAADSIKDLLAYVLPHRDTLLPGVPIEFGDVLISYTHKGRRAEFERVLTIDPFTPKPCPPSMYCLPYNDVDGKYGQQIGAKRPQGV